MSTPSDPSNEPSRIDRGKLLKRSAGIALGTSLYSFGDPLTVLAAQMTPKALNPDGDLAYFNWAQYIDPKLLRGFEKAYKVKVNESNFTNMENMLAKLRSGVKYDVAFPEAQTAAQLVKANFLAPLNHSNLPNWSQVNSAFHNPWYDAGAKYTVPYAIWTTGIAWRTDKIKGMTGSWNDLFNHPEAAKHTYLLDDFREVIGMGLLDTGVNNVNSTDSGQIGKSQEKILSVKPRLRGFTSVNTEMANGTSWLTHMWSGTVYQALLVMKHPETLHYQTNKEGVPVGSDTMVVLKNAPHPNTAQLFLNWMLAPEHSSQNVKQIGYPMMTTAGLKTYDGLTKKYPWLKVTTGEVEHGQKFKPQDPKTLQLWNTAWSKIQA
ncbi:MAG TPA: spermidine/putrescine ABC transporter substrate-binding protein [Gaiellales bacterium]|nr:spermidine/putrescine ABC transporter substrate-binding protein [Gaiellales bacterium]